MRAWLMVSGRHLWFHLTRCLRTLRARRARRALVRATSGGRARRARIRADLVRARQETPTSILTGDARPRFFESLCSRSKCGAREAMTVGCKPTNIDTGNAHRPSTIDIWYRRARPCLLNQYISYARAARLKCGQCRLWPSSHEQLFCIVAGPCAAPLYVSLRSTKQQSLRYPGNAL